MKRAEKQVWIKTAVARLQKLFVDCIDAIIASKFSRQTTNLLSNYYADIDKWYKDFCSINATSLWKLEQRIVSQNATEEDKTLYKILDAFRSRKSNIIKENPQLLQLATPVARKNAYSLLEEFEQIKKLQI